MFVKLIVFVSLVHLSTVQSFSREDKALNLNELVKNGATLTSVLFKSLDAGLDTVKPNYEKILDQMVPEARTIVKVVVKIGRKLIDNEKNWLAHVFSSLSTALKDLKPIQPCVEKLSRRGNGFINWLERDVSVVFLVTFVNHEGSILNLKKEATEVVREGRNLFDNGLSSILKCLAAGKKDSEICLNKNVKEIIADAGKLAGKISGLVSQADETLIVLKKEVVKKMKPILHRAWSRGKALLDKLGKCVSSLKKENFSGENVQRQQKDSTANRVIGIPS